MVKLAEKLPLGGNLAVLIKLLLKALSNTAIKTKTINDRS